MAYINTVDEKNCGGMGLLRPRVLIFPYFFFIWQKHMLDYSNHIDIWLVSLQGDTCQI